MRLNLALQSGIRNASGGTALLSTVISGVEVDWKYETSADIVLDTGVDVTQLVNRESGKSNMVQATAANMPHDNSPTVQIDDSQFARYDVGSEAAHGFLAAVVVKVTFNSFSNRLILSIDDSALALSRRLIETVDTDLQPTNGWQYSDSAVITGATAGEYYVLGICYDVTGTQTYIFAKSDSGGDQAGTVTTSGGTNPAYQYFRLGHTGTGYPVQEIAAVAFATGDFTSTDLENVRDHLYNWAVGQGLMT